MLSIKKLLTFSVMQLDTFLISGNIALLCLDQTLIPLSPPTPFNRSLTESRFYQEKLTYRLKKYTHEKVKKIQYLLILILFFGMDGSQPISNST